MDILPAQRLRLRLATDTPEPEIAVDIPYDIHHAAKEAGGSWDPKRKRWTIPASPVAVSVLLGRVNAASVGSVVVDLCPGVEAMRAEFRDHVDRCDVLDFPGAVLTPRPYQAVGSSIICQMQSTLLQWEMGVGKTKTAFDAIVRLRSRRVLVLCPLVVVPVWEMQRRSHVPDDYDFDVVALGASSGGVAARVRRMEKSLRINDAHQRPTMIVTNYEAARSKAFLEAACRWSWDVLVLDEIHRLKDDRTATNKAVRRIARHAKRRVGLTGTVTGNSRADLFGQMLVLDRSILGSSRWSFLRSYFKMEPVRGARGGLVHNGGRPVEKVGECLDPAGLDAKVARISTSIRKADVLDLPTVTHTTIPTPMSKAGREVYDAMQRDSLAAITSEPNPATARSVLARLTRCHQIASGFAVIQEVQPDGSEVGRPVDVDDSKASALRDLLSDLRGEPVVVFCRYLRNVATVKSVAQSVGRPAFEITGESKQVAEFTASARAGEAPVVAVQWQAGSVGIDLTVASYGVVYSSTFSLIDYEQGMARIDRFGQTRPVTMYHLISPHTVDGTIMNAVANKKDVLESVIDSIRSADEFGTGAEAADPEVEPEPAEEPEDVEAVLDE